MWCHDVLESATIKDSAEFILVVESYAKFKSTNEFIRESQPDLVKKAIIIASHGTADQFVRNLVHRCMTFRFP